MCALTTTLIYPPSLDYLCTLTDRFGVLRGQAVFGTENRNWRITGTADACFISSIVMSLQNYRVDRKRCTTNRVVGEAGSLKEVLMVISCAGTTSARRPLNQAVVAPKGKGAGTLMASCLVTHKVTKKKLTKISWLKRYIDEVRTNSFLLTCKGNLNPHTNTSTQQSPFPIRPALE